MRRALVFFTDRFPVGPLLALCSGTFPAGTLGADSVNPWDGRAHQRDRSVSQQAAGRAAGSYRGAEDNVAARRGVRSSAFGRIRHRRRDCGALRAGGHRVVWRSAQPRPRGARGQARAFIEYANTWRREGAIEHCRPAVLTSSVRHLAPASAARMFTERTPAANKLLTIVPDV